MFNAPAAGCSSQEEHVLKLLIGLILVAAA